MENFFLEHLEDLSEKSRNKNIFTFSNFLNEDEINELIKHKKRFVYFSLFGGTDGTSRKMVRFGDADELYYSEDFPVDTIKISPLNIKFAEKLSHRDYLGAIMNLSIERELIGDIIIKDFDAFVFVKKSISGFICENLTKVRHTDVRCCLCEFEATDELYKTEDITVISSSLRTDCVICSVFKLSRSNAEQLFNSKKVFINSSEVENGSKLLKENDTVSVRGFGKFIYKKELSSTKKGRLKLMISIYR